jgi:tetraacyldisaccharide 4'-kinase
MPEPGRLRSWVQRGWYAAQPHRVLLPPSWLFGALLAMRNALYRLGWRRSAHAGVPTIVIGNVTVGGTGKTPLVLWLAQALQRRGRRPGVVLRGYGGRQRTPHLLGPTDDTARVGDEAVLLAARARCPIAVGARRVLAARLLVEAGCDVVISDDGLQHLAMQRDLEVLVIDGQRGLGNGALLPAGPLRERASPWQPGRIVVVHGVDQREVVPAASQPLHLRLVPVALRQVAGNADHGLERLRDAVVHAVAGIGNPQRFFDLLRSLGAHPVEHAWPDHHVFRAGDLVYGDGHPVVMTEKDAVKCRVLAAGRDDIWCLEVTAELSEADGARLLERVLALRSM